MWFHRSGKFSSVNIYITWVMYLPFCDCGLVFLCFFIFKKAIQSIMRFLILLHFSIKY